MMAHPNEFQAMVVYNGEDIQGEYALRINKEKLKLNYQ